MICWLKTATLTAIQSTVLPPYVIMFLALKIIKKWHFLTPLPPTSDYVIYEWSLTQYSISYTRVETNT